MSLKEKLLQAREKASEVKVRLIGNRVTLLGNAFFVCGTLFTLGYLCGAIDNDTIKLYSPAVAFIGSFS